MIANEECGLLTVGQGVGGCTSNGASVEICFTGTIPWNAFPGKICGSALENICNTNEVTPSPAEGSSVRLGNPG